MAGESVAHSTLAGGHETRYLTIRQKEPAPYFGNIISTAASTHLEQVGDRIALVDQNPIEALTAYGHRGDHSPCLEQAFGLK